jgi:putrescine importer
MHVYQLRQNGAGLALWSLRPAGTSERRFRLHLRWEGDQSVSGLCDWMEHGNGLLAQSIICIIWCSKAAINFLPAIPYWIWAIVLFSAFNGLNLRGVKTFARISAVLAAGMGIVILIFFANPSRYIAGHPHNQVGFFTRPF